MTKKRKIILGICGAVTLLISAFLWFALSYAPVRSFEYSENGTGITIDKYNGHRMFVRVPNTIDGLPVTEIGDGAFGDKSFVRKVTLPETTVRFGASAFKNTPLKSITIPSQVKEIGKYAFCDTSLKSISFPEGVTEISENVLSFCEKLEYVYIPNSVKTLGNEAFSYCDSLKSLNLPNSVAEIGDSAFEGSGLEEINIPNSLEKVGYRIFNRTNAEEAYLEDEFAVLNEHILTCTMGRRKMWRYQKTLPSSEAERFQQVMRGMW